MTAREGKNANTAGSARFVHTQRACRRRKRDLWTSNAVQSWLALARTPAPMRRLALPREPRARSRCPFCRDGLVQQHVEMIWAQNCAHLHSRVPRPEITLPLTPSALGLGPLRLNHTFSKPMLRRVLLKKKKAPSFEWRKKNNQEHRVIFQGTGPPSVCSHRAMVFMGDKNVIPGAGVTACNDQCHGLAARCSPSPGAPAPVCASPAPGSCPVFAPLHQVPHTYAHPWRSLNHLPAA